MKKLLLFFIAFFILLSGCAPKRAPKKIAYKKLSSYKIKKIIQELSPLSQGLHTWMELKPSLEATLNYLSKRRGEYSLPGLNISNEQLKNSIKALLKILPLLDRDPYLLEKKFKWFEIEPPTFFTGYFEMDVSASFKKEGEYKYPIYGVPKDLKKVNLGKFHPRWRGQTLIYRIEGDRIEPYYSRKEIEKYHAIKDKARVIAWAKSPVDVFFLQIQGSGRLILSNGTVKYIGYAGKNGRQYISLGKYLIKQGYITKEQATLDGIINYLNNHPQLVPDILYVNPSYVFFRILQDGPIGAMGIKLKPFISLATDPKLIPLGTIGVYEVDLPIEKDCKVRGLFMAQDVGGAIKNNHVDLFVGYGKMARKIAGSLSSRGHIYLLLKRDKK